MNMHPHQYQLDEQRRHALLHTADRHRLTRMVTERSPRTRRPYSTLWTVLLHAVTRS